MGNKYEISMNVMCCMLNKILIGLNVLHIQSVNYLKILNL